MKSYLKYRALVYDPTANRQWESVNSPAEERLLLTRPGTQSYWVLPKFFSRICELNRKVSSIGLECVLNRKACYTP